MEVLKIQEKLLFEDWGLIDYREALDRQLALVTAVQEKESPEVIVTCRHPSVVTVGRSTKPEDIFGWAGPKYEIQRGGRATYHGPGQLVVYPILDLGQRGKDLHGYMRSIEESVVKLLNTYGVGAYSETGATGVWVEKKKVASIGIGVKRWVTYHGLALNVLHDPLAFQGINPCGFSASDMTSMEELLQRAPSLEKVTHELCAILRHQWD